MFQAKKYKSDAEIVKSIPLSNRRCFFHPSTTDENNFDPMDGKLYQLELAFRNGNRKDQRKENIILICRKDLRPSIDTPYSQFKIKSGRVQ
jgi:hypothetical protein